MAVEYQKRKYKSKIPCKHILFYKGKTTVFFPFNRGREYLSNISSRNINRKPKRVPRVFVRKFRSTYQIPSLHRVSGGNYFHYFIPRLRRKRNNEVRISVEPPEEQVRYTRQQGRSVIRNNLPKRKKTILQHQSNVSSQHGIGITGLDRTLSPSKSKYIWIIAITACALISLYQCGVCCYEYGFGTPSIRVALETRSQIKLPRILVCPTDITSRNPATDNLKQKYKEKFNRDKPFPELFFDFLKLDEINITSLWNLYEINKDKVMVSAKCSTSKSDHDCAKNIEIEEFANAGGRCVSILIKDSINIFGSLTQYNVIVAAPTKFTEQWTINFICLRHIFLPQEQNPLYVELDVGSISSFGAKDILEAEAIEIRNVNWVNSPCEDSDKVELCIQKCIEDYLYSHVDCRLPFMTRKELKDCDTPDNFHRSFLNTKKAMLEKYNCTKSCPRKCKEVIILMSRKLMDFKQFSNINVLIFKDNKVLIIEEYQQYTFNDLLANVGGSLGFFLDLNMLTLLEILEVMIVYFRKLINRKNVIQIKPKLQLQESSEPKSKSINLSIAGIQAMFNNKESFLRRLYWATAYIILGMVCVYQISKTTLLFINGDPDTLFIAEKNFSVRFPTITLCPYQPYTYWNEIQDYKEIYQFEFNSTKKINDIPFSDLMRVPDINILEFWNKSGVNERMIGYVDLGCRKTSVLSENDDITNTTITTVYTVNGKCISLHLDFPVRFKGSSTSFCVFFQYLPKTTAKFTLCTLLHNQEDDVRTLDPHQCFPVYKGLMGQIPIYIRKRESLNTRERPCSSSSVVAKCESECYDKLLNQAVTCSVPFMKNTNLKPCDDAEAFNHTMESAFNIMRNYSGKWCNCPRKCKEYMYEIHLSGIPVIELPFSIISYTVPKNVFLATKEYNRVNFTIFFASICGFLGLYFGVCSFHILEILEFLMNFCIKCKLNK